MFAHPKSCLESSSRMKAALENRLTICSEIQNGGQIVRRRYPSKTRHHSLPILTCHLMRYWSYAQIFFSLHSPGWEICVVLVEDQPLHWPRCFLVRQLPFLRILGLIVLPHQALLQPKSTSNKVIYKICMFLVVFVHFQVKALATQQQ